MALLSELKDFKPVHTALLTVGFLAMISPGFLTIFVFRPELFDRYDVVKLTLLSVSMTLPVVTLNYFMWWLGQGFDLKEEKALEDAEQTLFVSFIMTSLAIFPSLLVAYFLDLDFRWFGGFVVFWELLFVRHTRKKRMTLIKAKAP